jgi:beta-phosphoglucomutase
MVDKFTADEKVKMATEKNSIYQSLIKEFTKENLSEGALDLLKALKADNIMIGLASVSKNAPFLLEAMEINEYFDVVVNPNEIKNGKPAPDIFLMAAQKLNVKPENCVGIEDAYAGVESIKSAGMTPVGIGTKEVLSNCDTVLSSLTEVNIEFLRGLL